MCHLGSTAADLQQSEAGYLPPHTVVSAQPLVRFLVLVPPVLHGRPTVYQASKYRPRMWYTTCTNPDMLPIASPESSKLLQHCAVQIHTNHRHLRIEDRSMRERSRNKENEQSVGNILLSSQRTTCMGPVGGAASSDSIRFCSNLASFRLICPFVFSWSILTLSSSISTCFPSGCRWSSISVPIVRPGSGVEAGSDPRGHLWVTWGVYLCAGKPPLAGIILSHPPDLTRCDSVIGSAIPAMSGHIQYQGAAS